MNESTTMFLPPEWTPQRAILLIWPHETHDWHQNAGLLAGIEETYSELAYHISRQQACWIVCYDTAHKEQVVSCLEAPKIKLENIHYYIAPSNDTWARDTLPISVLKNGEAYCLDFQFNGWGNKCPAEKDNALSAAIFRDALGPQAYKVMDFILEGGAIDVNGEGVMITTSHCLLNPNRNPSLTPSDYESLFQKLFGIKKTIWLSAGDIVGDDTDGHVDMLARFVNANTICYASCNDVGDEHYKSLNEMKNQLHIYADEAEKYKLVPLPIPKPIYNESGERLPASYLNFLIINHAVLVPLYDDPADQVALKTLTDTFPAREVIGISALNLIHQGGAIHCATMQFPEEVMMNE